MPTLHVLENLVPPAGETEPIRLAGDSLPPLLRQVFSEGQAFLPDGGRVPLHSNVSREEAEVLYRAVRHLRPTRSLELGFAQGISALAILQALEDNAAGQHDVIDPFQHRFQNVGLAMTARAGLAHRLNFHQGYAEEIIPDLPPLQFAFIDSSHLFDLTLTEFVLADKKLAVGGLIGFHDLWMPSLRKLVRYVLTNRSYELVRTFDPPDGRGRRPLRRSIKRWLLSWPGLIPGAARLFRNEVQRPWSAITESNLVLLRKTADDRRDWQFHEPF